MITTEEFLDRGRFTVAFLSDLAERLTAVNEYRELALDCERLAAILSIALDRHTD